LSASAQFTKVDDDLCIGITERLSECNDDRLSSTRKGFPKSFPFADLLEEWLRIRVDCR
jgi:hypothetical protein